MHAAYWILTHPLNKFWMRHHDLTGFSGGFIRFDPAKRDAPDAAGENDWKRIRDRWEYSHVVRAVLAGLSLISLARQNASLIARDAWEGVSSVFPCFAESTQGINRIWPFSQMASAHERN